MKKILFNIRLIYWALCNEDKLNAYLLYKDAKNIYQKKVREHKNSREAHRNYCLKRAVFDSICMKG
jgi:hypothetical protein